MSKHKKDKKKLQKQLKYSLKALLSADPSTYGASSTKQQRLGMFAQHVMSNPSVKENKKFYIKNVLTNSKKKTRGHRVLELPYTETELKTNSQQWLTYTIGSLIRRGAIKSVSTFERIS